MNVASPNPYPIPCKITFAKGIGKHAGIVLAVVDVEKAYADVPNMTLEQELLKVSPFIEEVFWDDCDQIIPEKPGVYEFDGHMQFDDEGAISFTGFVTTLWMPLDASVENTLAYIESVGKQLRHIQTLMRSDFQKEGKS